VLTRRWLALQARLAILVRLALRGQSVQLALIARSQARRVTRECRGSRATLALRALLGQQV
jgi:hypothetical protein